MLFQEFVDRTGFEPTPEEYAGIEEAYYLYAGNKDEFCKEFVRDHKEKRIYANRAALIEQLRSELTERDKYYQAKLRELQLENEKLKYKLEEEQEWRPYTDSNSVSQADYEKLASGVKNGGSCRYMTEEEVLDWVCDEFGFDRRKVRLITEIDELEVNRHGVIRGTGKKIDRRPVYCATDYQYIAFRVGCWTYECWNDTLRKASF